MPAATSNTVTTTVGQVASVSISPASDTKLAKLGAAVDFAVSVTNSGNGSDTFDLSTSTQSGSVVTIYKDDNGDGQRQSTETTVVTATSVLAAGGTFKCIVVAQLPGTTASDTVTLTAKSRFDAAKTAQSKLTIQDEDAYFAGYIRSWLVNGYYPNPDPSTLLSKDYLGGEADVGPVEGSTSGGKTWFRVDSSTEHVDLDQVFGYMTDCVAYAHAYVYSPTAQTVNMWAGSDDGIKIWLNGAVVWTNNVYRAFTADSDRTTVGLVQGWNKLLVKVSQGTGSWGFSVRLCDSAGNPVPGLLYAVEPASEDDTKAPVISNVKITPGSTSALVEWDTDEPASTLLDYGTSASLGTGYADGTLATHHRATISGLTASTMYYVKVGSADASGNIAWVGGYTFQTAPAGPYILSWLVNGYYPNSNESTRLTTDYLGGEDAVVPVDGSVSGGSRWFVVQSPAEYLDMAKAFGYPRYCAGYAAAYVYSPVQQTVGMWIGSNDGTKIWLNGTVVWFNDVYRSFTIDKDRTTVILRAGWNRLVIKLSQGTGSWGLSVKFCDSSGNAIPGICYALQPADDPAPVDTIPPVISGISVTTTDTQAVVEWITDEPAITEVDYGTTPALGLWGGNLDMVLYHKVMLTGLRPGTTYFYSILAADELWNISTSDLLTFQTKPSGVSSGPYILSWLVNGYYPNSNESTRLTTDYLGGEASVVPVDGSVSAGSRWFVVRSPAEYLDMAKAFGYPRYCAGYAAAYVYSPVQQTVGMWIGSNDGTKIWLNGTVVWFNDVYRSFTIDKDRTTLTLRAGWNRLVIKLSQGTGSWGLSVKFCDSLGNPIPGIFYAVAP